MSGDAPCPFCGAPAAEDRLRWRCGTVPWPGGEDRQSYGCAEIARLRERVAELEATLRFIADMEASLLHGSRAVLNADLERALRALGDAA